MYHFTNNSECTYFNSLHSCRAFLPLCATLFSRKPEATESSEDEDEEKPLQMDEGGPKGQENGSGLGSSSGSDSESSSSGSSSGSDDSDSNED